MKNPLVSIIVTTKNEEQNIASCLQSIEKQTYANIETIVVDNASTDRTLEICKQFSVNIFRRGPERSAQRNFGAKISNGEHLLFLDADMELSKDVLQQYVDLTKKKNIYGCIIPEASFGIGFWAACKAFERSFYLGISWIEAARFYRKDIFNELGGFDEQITGPEDFDLSQRLVAVYGAEFIGRTASNIRHNEGELHLWRHLKKKLYYGRQMKQYVAKKHNEPHIIQQVSFLHRYGLFLKDPASLVKHPMLAVGMFVLKTLELAALFFGFILS